MKTLLPFLPDQNAACDALRRWSEASVDPFDQFHAIATILEEETDLAVELGWSGEAVARGQIDFWQLRLQLAHLALDAFLPRRMSAFYASTDVARETFLRTALWTVHFGASFGWTEGAAFTLGLLSRLGQCPLQELLARVKPFWRAPSRDSLAALVAKTGAFPLHGAASSKRVGTRYWPKIIATSP